MDEIAAAFAKPFDRPDGPEFRSWLLERLETGSDPRADRYWQLIGVINRWPAAPSLVPVFEWLIEALRAA